MGKKIITALGIICLILITASLADAGKVYLLSGGDPNQDNAIKTALEGPDFGHQVTIGVEHQNFNGTGTQSLAGYDEVIFLDSNDYLLYDMPEAGQVVLLNFIQAGGGLITGEWVYVDAYLYPPFFAILNGALPGFYSGTRNSASSLTYTAVPPVSTLNSQVTSPFTFNATSSPLVNPFGTESVLLAKPGATTFYSSSGGGPGLLGWTYGSGRVLSFSTPIGPAELGNSNYKQLLSNAVNWRPASPTVKNDVYVISGGDPAQDYALMQALANAGHRITVGPPAHRFYGLSNLSDYKVVIFLDSNFILPPDMPATGQQALLNFIKSGHGLITGEWVLYFTTYNSLYQTLSPAFPGSYNGNVDSSSTSITYTVQTQDPVLNQGLTSSFTFTADNYAGTQSDIVSKTGAKAFYSTSTSLLHSGLVGWQYSRGKVLNFSTCIGTNELSDSNYQKLLSNAVKWATPHPNSGVIELLILY